MKKWLFYLLSFTWGILITSAGLLVGLGAILLGAKSLGKFGYCWVLEFGRGWGGLSMGPTMIISKDFNTDGCCHEHGHAIQNCWFGPLMPFIVSIPSAIRYWYREFRYSRRNVAPPTPYNSIWFEKQATEVGTNFINKYFRR